MPVFIGAIDPRLIIAEGFLREHEQLPAEQRAAREQGVDVIGSHVGTVADEAAPIFETNAAHTARPSTGYHQKRLQHGKPISQTAKSSTDR